MNVESDENIEIIQPSLWRLFWVFLKIGSTAFGGFMALISVVQSYVVDKEKMLTNEEMMDGISLAMILPGPVAVNTVAYTGYQIRGLSGAVVCATAVTIPSFLLIIGLSYAYFTWGNMPQVSTVFQGFLPAVAAIIVSAAFKMSQNNITGVKQLLIATAALLAITIVGGFFVTLGVIIVSGLYGWIFLKEKLNEPESSNVSYKKTTSKSLGDSNKIIFISLIFMLVFLWSSFNAENFIESKLLATFSGMSLLLFGGGFVFIPLMQESIVNGFQWLTHQEFIDGIAMGQLTPGPILISATFIGYKVAGLFGATIATIGIFVPSALLMLFCSHHFSYLKKSRFLTSILKGIRCGVIGMVVAAAYAVAKSSQLDSIFIVIFITSLYGLIKLKWDVVWIIPLSGLVGLLAY